METSEATRPPDEVRDLIATEEENIAPEAIGGVEDEATFLLKTQLITSLEVNRDQRRRYARNTFWLTVTWITLVILIVAANGLKLRIFGEWRQLLSLSDAVVITLISTTTLNVFGFFLLVMKYLFNTEELKEMKDVLIKNR